MNRLPDNATILVIRAQQELQELDQVRQCIDDARVRVATNLALRDRLDVLIGNGERDLRALARGTITDHSEGWASLEEAHRWNGRIKRESLALVLGALLQDADLDGGLGRVTNQLFDSLSQRTGIELRVATAVGDSEFLDRTLELARTRFPDTTVWGLPIMAHEFGHHVARVLPHSDPDLRGQVWPLADLLAEEADVDADVLIGDQDLDQAGQDLVRVRAGNHLNEIFADVYATYALGASYALAAIVLRAKVGHSAEDSASAESDTHPSWARRVVTMCAALRVLSSLTGDLRFRRLAEGLVEPIWDRIGVPTRAQGPLIAHAEPQARRIVESLIDHAPQRLRSAYGNQGPQLRALLTAAGPIRSLQIPAGSTLSQVLEASWQWRASDWSADQRSVARVSDRALELAQRVDP